MTNSSALLFLMLAVFCWPGFAQEQPGAKPGAIPKTGSESSKSKVACTDNSKREVDLPPPGRVCEEQEYAKRGRPIFFAPQAGYVYGVSAAPENLNEISIWLNNQTDEVQDYYVCCRASFFLRIDLYDAAGQLVPGGLDALFGCGCSGWVRVTPHTIKYVDGGDLKDGYVLKPGRYAIGQKPLSAQIAAQQRLPTEGGGSDGGNKPARTSSGPELKITIP